MMIDGKLEVSLENVTRLLQQIDALNINMGLDEKRIQKGLWCIKVKQLLSNPQNLNLLLLNNWYQEGANYNDVQEQMRELLNFINQGQSFKNRLIQCTTIEGLELLRQEVSTIPFDFKQVIIEQKTRIEKKAKILAEQQAKQILQKKQANQVMQVEQVAVKQEKIVGKRTIKPNIQNDYHYGGLSDQGTVLKGNDAMRQHCVNVLYNLLMSYPPLQPYQKKLPRISKILEKSVQQLGNYKQQFQVLQKNLIFLLNFQEFQKRIVMEDFNLKQLATLSSSEARNSTILQKLIGTVPEVSILINSVTMKPEGSSTLQQIPVYKPQRKKMIKQKKKTSSVNEIKKLLKLTDNNSAEKATKNETQNQVQAHHAAQKQNTSISSILSSMDNFRQKQEEKQRQLLEKEISKKEEIVRASENYRNKLLEFTSQEQEEVKKQQQLSQTRLQLLGLPSLGDGNEQAIDFEDGQHGNFSSEDEEKKDIDSNNMQYSLQQYTSEDKMSSKDYRKFGRLKNKQFDPFKKEDSSKPLNAPQGSLLQLWQGSLEYNKKAITDCKIYSLNKAETLQKLPTIPNNIVISGRTPLQELWDYLKKAPQLGKIQGGWIEPPYINKFQFLELDNELHEKNRAFVVKLNNSFTLYLLKLTSEFNQQASSIKLQVLQNVHNSISDLIEEENPRMAVIFLFKKQAYNKTMGNLKLQLVKLAPEMSPAPILPKKEKKVKQKTIISSSLAPGEMSPVTSEDPESDHEQNSQKDNGVDFLNFQQTLQTALQLLAGGESVEDKKQILKRLKDQVENLTEQQIDQLRQSAGINAEQIRMLINTIQQQMEGELIT